MKKITVGYDINNRSLGKAYREILGADPKHKRSLQLVKEIEDEFAKYVREQIKEGRKKK